MDAWAGHEWELSLVDECQDKDVEGGAKDGVSVGSRIIVGDYEALVSCL